MRSRGTLTESRSEFPRPGDAPQANDALHAWCRRENVRTALLRQLARLRLTGEQIEQALHYLDTYLEETDPGALQRELAALDKDEYREAGMLIEHFTKLGLEKGLEQGIEQGILASKLEDARKMLDRGCDWAFITDITGMKPEDLEG